MLKSKKLNDDMGLFMELEMREFFVLKEDCVSWTEKLRARFEREQEEQIMQADHTAQVDTLHLTDKEAEEIQTSEAQYEEESLPSSGSLISEVQEVTNGACARLESPEPVEVPLTNIEIYMRDLELALRESRENLDQMEETMNENIQYGILLAGAIDEYKNLLAKYHSSVDLVIHISGLLKEETGLQPGPPYPVEVEDTINRWERLNAKERDRLLQEALRQWEQFLKDMASLEAWLTDAEAHQSDHSMVATTIQDIESLIQTHKQFLLELDSHKAVLMSLNLCQQNIVTRMGSKGEARKIKERLKKINARWDKLCKYAVERQLKLQASLMQCKEFLRTIDELLTWLQSSENAIRQAEPVDVSADLRTVAAKRDRFVELKADLEQCEHKVLALQEMASQLLITASSSQEIQTSEKIAILAQRIQILKLLCDAYIINLNKILESEDVEPSQRANLINSDCEKCMSNSLLMLSKQYLENDDSQSGDFTMHQEIPGETPSCSNDDPEPSTLSRCGNFLGRVMRAALPIQALMLLLLGIASLVPVYEEDYQCALSNNFARSLDPMLQYKFGPPPI